MENNIHYKDLLDNLSSGCAVFRVINNGETGKDYIVETCNKKSLELEGKTLEEVVGKSIFELRPNIDKYGLIDVFKKVWETGETGYFPIKKYNDSKFSNYYNRVFKTDDNLIVALYNDVTDYMQIQDELKSNYEKLEMYFEYAPYGVFIADEKGNYIDVNDEACKMTGYSKNELIGMNILDLMGDEDEEIAKQGFEGLDEVSSNKIELRYKKKSGENRIWTVNARKLDDNRYIGFAEDITGRKSLEKQIVVEQNKAQNYFNVANIMFIVLDEQGIVKDINNKGCDVLECEKDEAVGKNWFDNFLPKLNIDEIKGDHKKAVAQEIESVEFFENIIVSKSGKEKYIAWHNSLLKDDVGNVVGILSAGNDITQARLNEQSLIESENNFKLMFEDAPLPYQSLDENGDFIIVNKAWLDLLGYTKEEVIGNNFANFINPKYKKHFEENFPKFKYEGATCTVFEMQKKDGTMLSINFDGRIAYNGDGSFRQTHCIMQDITEQLKAEKKLIYLSYHDQLTGLYNRRFFEEELLRMDTEQNFPLTLVMTDVNGLKLINDSFGHSVGDELLKKTANIISKECRENDILARLGGDEFVLILPNTDEKQTEQIIGRLEKALSQEKIASVDLSVSFGYEIKNTIDESIQEVLTSAENYMYKRKVYESSSMHSKTIDIIMKALFEKSSRELMHSRRVSAYCEALANAMEMERNAVKQIKTAGLLHDIGKIGIDESILNKPGKLERDEWEEMKKHPESSWRILVGSDEFSNLAGFVQEHHERWDGKGYPKGLKNEEISLEARIIALADSYDAITSERTYKKAMTKEQAIAEIKECSGKQFDPNIVDIFIDKVLKKDYVASGI